MAFHEESARFVWDELPTADLLTTALPFRVRLSVVSADDTPIGDYCGHVTISAVTSRVCLAEGFEGRRLGLWVPNYLPGHYDHGFDEAEAAPGSGASLYLKGGNDSNFGMTLKLPTPGSAESDAEGAPAALPDDADTEDPAAFDGAFRPDAVAFYVRTDNEKADAGHFILGESNEVNKRVAQFQFTKDGRMGLLGTGGTTHGATPYEPHRWYHVELRFDWEKKHVAFYVDQQLQQRHIPFRRETSNYIGACALGNRDKCTTWFDSIRFIRETALFRTDVVARRGVAEAWIGPLSDEGAADGFTLRVEDAAGNVGPSRGPLWPLSTREGAQRVAINARTLSDFSTLLADEESSDISFIVEGKPLRAHRCILTARCEAFKGMFNSAMREGSRDSKEVPIHEVSHAAFCCMLEYIYGGAVRVPEELAVELLGLADRYLLDGLKQLCGFTLATMISVDTVARIIQAADRWDTQYGELKALCMEFILANYGAVVSHPVFEELASSPHLLLEITRAAARIVGPQGYGDDGGTTSSSSGWRPAKRQRKAT